MNIEQVNLDRTTDEEYYVEYPIRLLKFVLKKLKIKELLGKCVHDPRSRVDSYDLSFLLMHGLFTHIFRSPSKHHFQLSLLKPEASTAVAKFNGDHDHCPCTRTLDDILNNLEPNDFLPVLPAIFRSLCRGKVFQLHPEFIPQNEYSVAIDAHVTHIEGLKRLSKPIEVEGENKRFIVKQTIYFFNNIAYRQHNLSVIQLDESAEKKPSKRFAKVTSKNTHWEWIVRQYLTPTNVKNTATRSRLRWKQEDLFNDLQHRGFAICHDFNRAPTAQLIRTYLILIAYAICSILVHLRLGQSILSKGMTIIFMMQKMLADLIYISEGILFRWEDPGQIRWGKDPPKTVY